MSGSLSMATRRSVVSEDRDEWVSSLWALKRERALELLPVMEEEHFEAAFFSRDVVRMVMSAVEASHTDVDADFVFEDE